MFIKRLICLLIFIFISLNNVSPLPINDNQCTTKANGPGNCVRPGKCEALIKNEITIQTCNKCKTRGFICCPTLKKIVNIESNKMIPAIINGVPTKENQYPFMAALGILKPNSEIIEWKCGGSIIGPKLILTAAHCKGVTNIMVGTNNLIDIKPNQTIGKAEFDFISHKYYETVTRNQGPNDIAIIKLKINLTFNENIKAIALASQNDKLPDVATVIGFGSTEVYGNTPGKILMQIELYREDCSTDFRQIITNQICYGHKNTQQIGTCRGDSGGPLFVKKTSDGSFVQIGLVSFSFYACSLTPSAFTSIPVFRDWIDLQSQDDAI